MWQFVDMRHLDAQRVECALARAVQRLCDNRVTNNDVCTACTPHKEWDVSLTKVVQT